MLLFALQQLLAILAATIAVPTIIGIPTQIPAAIFGAGVGTLAYQLFTRFKSPVFLGSSFAFLSSLGVALAYGYMGILLGSTVASMTTDISCRVLAMRATDCLVRNKHNDRQSGLLSVKAGVCFCFLDRAVGT